MIIRDYKPVLFDGAYKKGEWALERYLAKGGYEAAKKVLAMKRDPATNNNTFRPGQEALAWAMSS